MSDKNPNALRIAAVLDIAANALGVSDDDDEIVMAAAELRRLHALCDEMGEALGGVIRVADRATEEFDRARAVHNLWKESK